VQTGPAAAQLRNRRGPPRHPSVSRKLYPKNYIAAPPPSGGAAAPKPAAEPAPRLASLSSQCAFNEPRGPFRLVRPADMAESMRQKQLDEEARSDACAQVTCAILLSTFGAAAAFFSGALLGFLGAAALGAAAAGMAYCAAQSFRSAAHHSNAAARARCRQSISPLTLGDFTDGGVAWPNPYRPDCDEAKLVAFRIAQARKPGSFADSGIEGVYLEQVLNASIQLFVPAPTGSGLGEGEAAFEYHSRCSEFKRLRHAFIIYEAGHFQTLTKMHSNDIDAVTQSKTVSTPIVGTAVDVPGDGDCFFSAVFQSLYDRLPSHAEVVSLRGEVANKMAEDSLGSLHSLSGMMPEARNAFSRYVNYLGYTEEYEPREA
jgi:hypothetical protein